MRNRLSCPALVAILLPLLLLTACSGGEPASPVGIANPASVYCESIGGKLEIVKEASGERGVCHLPDGTVIDEWELFRRDHPQE